MNTQYESIIVELIDSVALVKLNNPVSLNSLSDSLKNDLKTFLSEAKNEISVRAIVLTGVGRAFCAGGDIKSLKMVRGVVQGRMRIKNLHDLIYGIRNMEKPVIAAVNGFAVGAGMNLALACDIIIAAGNAKFSEIFTNIGLLPDAGGLFFLPRLIGPARAKELCFTARCIDAAEAERIGLVNKVVPLDRLLDESLSIAKTIAKGPSVSIAYIKRLINKSLETDLDALLEIEAFAQGVCMNTEDFKEGVAAFNEKRPPTFQGK
jgi:2-(1,2-epoxy-1,2-dihydrophenyl)acetyl-CoA isomerase